MGVKYLLPVILYAASATSSAAPVEYQDYAVYGLPLVCMAPVSNCAERAAEQASIRVVNVGDGRSARVEVTWKRTADERQNAVSAELSWGGVLDSGWWNREPDDDLLYVRVSQQRSRQPIKLRTTVGDRLWSRRGLSCPNGAVVETYNKNDGSFLATVFFSTVSGGWVEYYEISPGYRFFKGQDGPVDWMLLAITVAEEYSPGDVGWRPVYVRFACRS